MIDAMVERANRQTKKMRNKNSPASQKPTEKTNQKDQEGHYYGQQYQANGDGVS